MKKMIVGAVMALSAGVALPLTAAVSANDATPSVEGTELYIISPADGETVKSPVTVRFGLRGMGIAPAGIDKPNTGHHHLIIDVDLPPADENIPMDENHIHFGGGQTEASIELTPGTHTLQLLLGDMNHIPHYPVVSSRKITITVVE